MTPQDRRNIKKTREFENRQNKQSNREFKDFKKNWNNGDHDLPGGDDFYVDIDFTLSAEFQTEFDAKMNKAKAKRKEEYENWKEVKREFLFQIELEYAFKPMFCPLCGELIHEGENISPDHIIPRAHKKKGENLDTVENLQPSHEDCNFRRGSNQIKIIKFYDTKQKANIERYIYQDIHRTSWNVTFKYYQKTPTICVI
ncbi:MAG: HNH endonuclease, partial [Alphaproteobacteria bacterium]|nr:HNH endonuclease [Alphaproteobacteria bacterium]